VAITRYLSSIMCDVTFKFPFFLNDLQQVVFLFVSLNFSWSDPIKSM
jgi:hypothetical protein